MMRRRPAVRTGRRRKSDAAAKKEFCGRIAQLAVKALLYEVSIAPKPGLVDRLNNGAHQDMDVYTFLDSACALSGYFRDITAEGMRRKRVVPGQLLPYLQPLGMVAEREMFRATSGVNTHKGIVYSMGIFCAACGYWYEKSKRVTAEEMLYLCGEIAGAPRLAQDDSDEAVTNGERLYQQYRIEGVRGEVFRGMPSVQLHGLPAFRHAMAKGWDINAAGIYALFHIMSHLEDTNLISRSDLKTQERIRKELTERLQNSDLSAQEVLEQAARMDKEFIGRNISPGGAADMLSITLLIWFLEQEFPDRFSAQD